ncbi:hypothetical protein B0A55_01683 [Friedmanniomyces simplex]|uniref:DUF7728 domain-containing protein n=1 Tax=Friedmanniomyces simplex TaxID=329884 RepID=A0A4U0XT97_9PEZI|nr:hypothetical protein B0A55_01683 [Friedmanniomyces simplex]
MHTHTHTHLFRPTNKHQRNQLLITTTMFSRTVGIAALGALSASALILPPGVARAGETLELAATTFVDPKAQSIIIPCSACAFPTAQDSADTDDALFWIQGGANSLLLDFSVSEDGEHLLLGGADLYSPRHLPSLPLSTIQVKQIPSYGVQTDITAGKDRSADLKVTEFRLMETKTKILSQDADRLVVLRLQITSLEAKEMSLDEVEVKLLETGVGELLIMQITNAPGSPGDILEDLLPTMEDSPPPPSFRHHPHGAPHDVSPKECRMLPAPLCKLRNVLESKIDAAMGPPHRFRKHGGGCRGRPGGPNPLPDHIKPPFMRPGEEQRAKHPHGRPHHMRPHGAHHGHHRHGRFWQHHFLHTFAKGMVAVLIPVMAGITVGMTVSLLGLVFGRLISFLWIKLVRGGRRGYASVALEEAVVADEEEEEEEEEEEGKMMVAEMEAPPLYENAPAYEEVEEKKEQQQ